MNEIDESFKSLMRTGVQIFFAAAIGAVLGFIATEINSPALLKLAFVWVALSVFFGFCWFFYALVKNGRKIVRDSIVEYASLDNKGILDIVRELKNRAEK
jgi:hypothetical protein